MQLSDYLDQAFVLAELKSRTKSEVLAELIAPIGAKRPDVDPALARKVLLEREGLGTTGIGDGIAIPHGKLPGLGSVIVAVGRSREGVDFEALDFKPCTIFFLVLAPEQVAGLHLRILAQISRLLRDEAFRRLFLAAEDAPALWKLLQGV
jgi:PTS system nitrogen regulatory IIA component